MSSILTNNSAMTALQTLKNINSNLQTTQSQISTGKEIASAKDNSAVWAISKTMESDVAGFKAISDSLSLGDSTVAVGKNAAETTTDLLNDIKEKVVAAQEENVDRGQLQKDIGQLRDQIASTVGAAQFNGKNLVDNTEATSILSSLDRSADQTVAASDITFNGQDLTQRQTAVGGTQLSTGTGGVLGGDFANATATATASTTSGTPAVPGSATFDFSSLTVADGNALKVEFGSGNTATYTAQSGDTNSDYATKLKTAIDGASLTGVTATVNGTELTIENTSATGGTFSIDGTQQGTIAAQTPATPATGGAKELTFDTGQAIEAGYSVGVDLEDSVTGETASVAYTASEGDTYSDLANGLQSKIAEAGLEDVTATVSESGGTVTLGIATSGNDLDITGTSGDDGAVGGGLEALKQLDVTTAEGAQDALDDVEGLIQTSIDAAAEFGSVQGRIETQSDFVSSLTDSLESGIGALVDANLEEASARLQALQTQQQLGTQALSIANSQSQNILALFRG